jgi:hypothetical protein
MTRRAMLSPETMGHVDFSVGRIDRTPTGALLTFYGHQDAQSLLPGNQDFKSIHSTVMVTLQSLPDGGWECTEAKTRVESISSSQGPLTDEPGNWQLITRDIQKCVDQALEEQGKGLATAKPTAPTSPGNSPEPPSPTTMPTHSVATAAPAGQARPAPKVGLKLVGLWEAELVIDEAKATQMLRAKGTTPEKIEQITRGMKKDIGAAHYTMELKGDGKLLVDDFSNRRAKIGLLQWHYESEEGNVVKIKRFQGAEGWRDYSVTLESPTRLVVDLPDLQNSPFKTPTAFNRVGDDNVAVGLIDTTQSLRDMAVDWIARSNVDGPKAKLVDDMEAVIDKKLAAHRDFSILFGAGLMKSGWPTWMFCFADRFFTFTLNDSQAAKLGLKPDQVLIHTEGLSVKRADANPQIELGIPVLDAKGPIDLNHSVKGHQAMRSIVTQRDAATGSFRLTYVAGGQVVSLYEPGPGMIFGDGKVYPLKFGVNKSALNYSGPTVLFFDFCTVGSEPQYDEIISSSTYGILVDVESSGK